MSLGIIAGGGDLPRAVAQSARADGRAVFVVALRGMCGEWAEDFPHEWVSLGEPGRALKSLEPKSQIGIFKPAPGTAITF